jgi:DNA-binding response OmpR family regulator
MPKKTILIVDNHPEFLDTCGEYIEQAGYRVIKAHSARDARSYAEQLHPDLAVVDVRLVNDQEEGDRTGVFLAESLRETCPVIILTDHASYAVVRQTLIPDANGRSLAVDFIDKHEGPAELIQAVKRVLKQSGQSKKGNIKSRTFWRNFRIFAFIVLCIPIVYSIFLAQSYDKAALIIGTVFAGLQVLVGIGTWIFEKRS